MRVVIQRVSHASVTIEGVCKSAIKEGFMILVGIEEADKQEMATSWLSANSPCTHLPRKATVPPTSVLQSTM